MTGQLWRGQVKSPLLPEAATGRGLECYNCIEGNFSSKPLREVIMAEEISGGTSMVSQIASLQDYGSYEDLHWEGSFEDYLHIVRERPEVTRNAFQRLYDMVIGYGEEEYIDNKKRLIRYPFFQDPMDNGRDAVHGLDIPLMRLVHVLQAAAQNYGPEKRIILLHGPVGSSKSTIARLLKKGLERYSRTEAGCLYSFKWVNLQGTGCVGQDDEVGEFPEVRAEVLPPFLVVIGRKSIFGDEQR